jgi:hypothetical protein
MNENIKMGEETKELLRRMVIDSIGRNCQFHEKWCKA